MISSRQSRSEFTLKQPRSEIYFLSCQYLLEDKLKYGHRMQVDDVQRNMVEKMEQNKLGLFAHFPTFDFVLFPVLNTRKLLHIVGLRVSQRLDSPVELSIQF